jgi:hypothetical protein
VPLSGVRKLLCCVLSAGLVSCLADCATKPDQQQAQRIEAIDLRLKIAEELIKSLETDTKSLNSDVFKLQLSSEPFKTAEFDPGGPGGYGRIDATGGYFLVVLENATPYVDGFRVTFRVGNPSSVTFDGLKVHAKWGPRADMKDPKFNWTAWQESMREKDIDLPDTLRAGAWNRVSFVLSPAKPEQFGYVALSLDTNKVSFAR